MKVISLDCESNGLGGRVFCVGTVLTDDDGTEIAFGVDRCPIDGPVDPWVADNVLPALTPAARPATSAAACPPHAPGRSATTPGLV